MALSCVNEALIPHHHGNGNVWGDSVLQALTSPYGAPEYSERAVELAEEIKRLFFSDIIGADDDLIKRLQIVDTIESLGIDRHFQQEIQIALDYVYRFWNDQSGIGVGSKAPLNCTDLNATALGFRCLRLHRYNVSSGVFEKFKDGNGQFFTGEARDVRCMLSLLRASSISLPGERVMEEANVFAREYLNQVVLQGWEEIHVDQRVLSEVKYALEFPWHCSPPLWEARSFIDIYGQDDSWLKLSINQKILELAKLDFNILQSVHQKELQEISRWWTDSDVAELNFYRKRHVEFYFCIVLATFESEFSASRIAFTKLCVIMTLLDDIYDTHGTLDELKLFTEGVKRWDLSLVDRLPDYMKVTFQCFLNTSNDLNAEVMKVQGRDMALYLRKHAWERFVDSYHQEAEWIAARHVPTFNDYLNNAALASSGMCVLNLYSLLLMGERLSDNTLEKIFSPSKNHYLTELAVRLTDDLQDFQDEQERGEFASGIECYLIDNPESTREDALNHMKSVIDLADAGLNWEFLKLDDKHLPLCCRKYAFNIVRGHRLIYKYRDGLSFSDKEIKDQIFKVLIHPVSI